MEAPNYWAILEHNAYSRKACLAVAEDARLCRLSIAAVLKEDYAAIDYTRDNRFGDKERMLAYERLSSLYYALFAISGDLNGEADVPLMILRRHAPPSGEVLRVYLMRLLMTILGRSTH